MCLPIPLTATKLKTMFYHLQNSNIQSLVQILSSFLPNEIKYVFLPGA